MSKPMVVTLPVIMILLDYWPLKRFQLKETGSNLKEVTPGKGPLWLLWEKIPFFILSAVFSIITICTQYNPSIKYFSLGSRLANAPVSFVTYLEKTFWPHDLAAFYPFSFQLPSWQVLGAVLLIIVISAAVIVSVKRLPYLFVGWLWYAITLLPVLGIIQSGEQAMADRYYYLPSIGIAIILAWGIPTLFKREGMRKKILLPAGVGFIAVLSFLTWQQCGYWKNGIELWSHTVQTTKNNYLAHNNLGNALYEEGKIKDSIYHYNEAIRINPDYDKVYYSRGNAYHHLGQYQLAIDDYKEAIRINPDYAKAYYNRGTVYGQIGQYQLAIEDYKQAIRLKPNFIEAYVNRGSTYDDMKQYQNALEDYSKAIRLKPDEAEFYNNRAIIYFNQGNKELGCLDFQKACKLGNCKILENARTKGFCR
jgi:tetratricopeptide (TPR) repeat protein